MNVGKQCALVAVNLLLKDEGVIIELKASNYVGAVSYNFYWQKVGRRNRKIIIMQPFDLDRFKAGEPAYDKTDNLECFYLTELPDGMIVIKYFWPDRWGCHPCAPHELNDNYYMKEKELTWEEVRKRWLNGNVNDLFGWLDKNFEPPKPKNK